MTNLEKYNAVFLELFDVKEDTLESLTYLRGKWDSLQHVQMINMLEDAFDISFSSTDVVLFNSYVKGKNILKNYDIEV